MAGTRKRDKNPDSKDSKQSAPKPIDVDKGFADVMEQVPYLVGLAETAHRSHPISAFNKGGAAAGPTLQELEKELKEMKAPPDVERKLGEEFKAALQCANKLGQAVFINDQKEYKKQKAELAGSCGRVVQEIKDAKGIDEAKRAEYQKKLENLNKKLLEDELTKAQRIAKQEQEANFARAQVAMQNMKQEELDDFRAAHDRWKPTGHPPPDPDADPKSQMTLVSGDKKLELKEGFYLKDNPFYKSSEGIDIRKDKDGRFYGTMRPAPSVWGFPEILTKRNYQNCYWEMYKLMNPSGKKMPLIMAAPGQTGPATLEGLDKAYNNGRNYEKTMFIERRVEYLLELAEKKGVRFEADAYLALLKTRIDDKRPNNWRSFTAADYHKLEDRYKRHNERMAALEHQEKTKIAKMGEQKIQADVVQRRDDKAEFLKNLAFAPKDAKSDPGEKENIKNNLEAEVKHVIDVISGFKECVEKVRNAGDATALEAAKNELQQFCIDNNLVSNPRNADVTTLYNDYLLKREALAEAKAGDIPDQLKQKYDDLNSEVQVLLSPGIEARNADLVKDKQQQIRAELALKTASAPPGPRVAP